MTRISSASLTLPEKVLASAKAAILSGKLEGTEEDVRAWLMKTHGAYIPPHARQELIREAAEELIERNKAAIQKQKNPENSDDKKADSKQDAKAKKTSDSKKEAEEEALKKEKAAKESKAEADAEEEEEENKNKADLDDLFDSEPEMPEFDPNDLDNDTHLGDLGDIDIHALEEADLNVLQEDLLNDIKEIASIGDQAAMFFIVSQISPGNMDFRIQAAQHLDQFVNDASLPKTEKLLAYAGAESLRNPNEALLDVKPSAPGAIPATPGAAHFSLIQNTSDDKLETIQDEALHDKDVAATAIIPGFSPIAIHQAADEAQHASAPQEQPVTPPLSPQNNPFAFPSVPSGPKPPKEFFDLYDTKKS